MEITHAMATPTSWFRNLMPVALDGAGRKCGSRLVVLEDGIDEA